MSKTARVYLIAGLVLVGFPVFLALWGLAASVMAILMMGLGFYAVAVCLLCGCLWHRFHFGTWPIEIEDDPIEDERYPIGFEPLGSGPRHRRRGAGAGIASEVRYRLSATMQGLLRKLSSNV